jgi:uncharacterized protein (DUF58 family)
MQEPPRSSDSRKYLDPKVLTKLSRLELKARLIVEGFISGLHRSPFRGFSVEFAEHREYVPGDDIRHVDWKVYGRSDRYYIKQYEEETNLKAHILVDVSESMAYPALPGGSPAPGEGPSKFEYASWVAASLAHLVLRQRDAVGLTLFDDRVRRSVPPSSSPGHLGSIVAALENPGLAEKTNAGSVLHEFADRLKRKGLVIIISDLFDDIERVKRGLRHLRHRGHEVIVFHILAHDELVFPFERLTLFEGLEGLPEKLAHPRTLRDAYLAELEAYLSAVRRACRDDRIDYVRIDTESKLDVALSSYLAARSSTLRT